MRLRRVEIEGYRSASKRISLALEPNVTVILGANDHGKTNLLDALRHLNADNPFDLERDLNWDRSSEPTRFPEVLYAFVLTNEERQELCDLENESRTSVTGHSSGSDADAAGDQTDPFPENDSVESGHTQLADSDAQASVPSADLPPLTVADIPEEVVVVRRGVQISLIYPEIAGVGNGVFHKYLQENLPRVEIIRAQEKVPDSVTAAALRTDEHEFMRGIFYYASLNPKKVGEIFNQTDSTMMQLDNASAKLNLNLRNSWSQGKDLTFRLVHESKTDEIILRIKDPSVEGRLVRASRRSSGFTHFFTLKTILHARQQEHPANSYIFLFDEPGAYLHPFGQHDLIQVLDTIGKTSQIVYATHSIFMINKTFPTRHRLIVKTAEGTRLDGKPFIGRWGSAVQALGLSLAGTVLFAQHVLLVEGDSDPILIQSTLQKLVALGKINIDLNAFSVISTDESKNADALLRLMFEGAAPPKVAILVDGDDGGKERLRSLKTLMENHKIEGKQLIDETAVEDHLPLAGELYVRAVAEYVTKLMQDTGREVANDDDLRNSFRASYRERFDENKVTAGLATWAMDAGKKIGKLERSPSKVGIAREYARLLEEAPPDHFTPQAVQRAVKLADWIKATLELPELADAPAVILRE